MVEIPERLAERIERLGSGCWIWQGGQDSLGYGVVRWQGRVWRTHRLMLHLQGVPLPDGTRGAGQMDIDHTCRTPQCCNPEHLEVVTHRENCQRRTRLITECPQGHPYDEANTRFGTDGRRDCRACDRDRKRRKRSRVPTPLRDTEDT